MADYKALYRKWRPFDFDDVCGQSRITDILKFEVATGKVSHAYLFCGSRGTGKTSCAKILAKAVNCESPVNGNPCNKCESCRSIDMGIATDVIEMDAASNNGVDNVRNLKDEISFTPAILKYRVYIIDEVHMMSGAAFNALLKTLEEPPEYVVFILATTEYNKLPTTIVSRCQRFDFRRIGSDVIVERLSKIAKEEGILLDNDGARLIARASRGGLRDAISLLELCAGSKQRVDAALVAETIGAGDREGAYRLIEALAVSDYSTVYEIIRDVVMSSGDMSVFWQELIDSYRDVMVCKTTDKAKSYLDLTDNEFERVKGIADRFTMAKLSYHTSLLENALSEMQRATNSKRSIAEIALTRMCDPRLVVTAEALALRVEELEKQISLLKMGVAPAPIPVLTEDKPKDAVQKPMELTKPTVSEEAVALVAAKVKEWGRVLERIGEIKSSLAGRLKGSKAYRQPGGEYTVYMNEFFISSLSQNQTDQMIIKGAIGEKVGCDPQSITVKLEPISSATADDLQDELEEILNN